MGGPWVGGLSLYIWDRDTHSLLFAHFHPYKNKITERILSVTVHMCKQNVMVIFLGSISYTDLHKLHLYCRCHQPGRRRNPRTALPPTPPFAFPSSSEPTVHSVTSPSRITALVAQQERNQPGHLVRRAQPLDLQPRVVARSGHAQPGSQRGEHGRVNWASEGVRVSKREEKRKVQSSTR